MDNASTLDKEVRVRGSFKNSESGIHPNDATQYWRKDVHKEMSEQISEIDGGWKDMSCRGEGYMS